MFRFSCSAAVLAALFAATTVIAQRPDAFQGSRDQPAIQYSTREVDNVITRLNQQIEAGKARLEFNQANGYLTSLLSALRVPIESQLVVFSETSFNAELINPKHPRALFFNDVAAVGWVKGAGVVEIAAHDPRQGVIFYTLDQKSTAKPQLKRDQRDCLLCHLTWDTLAVPGMVTMSTFPMSDDPNAYATGVAVDHQTPFDQRWGGWYVTGKSVPARHFGNLPVIRPAREIVTPAPPAPVLPTLDGKFDTTGFPTRFSDVVAHLVLGHQTHMTNLLTRLGWEARVVAAAPGGRGADASRVTDAVHDLVDYMLFVDEAPFPKKIEGSSGYAELFASLGPKDNKGRSLRQFDLQRRMMRYPCSYMIYSPAFDALPATARDAVYQRLWAVLSGRESAKPYQRLSLADRQAIVEILRETKKDLPAYFQTVSK
jgi:hypothetical protein